MCWRQDYSVFQGGKICKFLRARGKRKWPCVDLCDGDSFPLFSSHGNDLSPFSKNPISALAAELLPGMGYLPRRLGPNNCFTPNLVRCRGAGVLWAYSLCVLFTPSRFMGFASDVFLLAVEMGRADCGWCALLGHKTYNKRRPNRTFL